MHPTNSELQARSVIFLVSFVCESVDQSQVRLGCIEDPLFWEDCRGLKFQLYSSSLKLKLRHLSFDPEPYFSPPKNMICSFDTFGTIILKTLTLIALYVQNCAITYFQLSGAIICTLTPAGNIPQRWVAQRVGKNRANEQNLYICCYLMINSPFVM